MEELKSVSTLRLVEAVWVIGVVAFFVLGIFKILIEEFIRSRKK